MVLYDERGACFVQTLSAINTVGWPQAQPGIEEGKPKYIQDYRQGNQIFGSPPLASEANVISRNQNFPSQVQNSSSSEIARTYLRGSPVQEIMRDGNCFQVLEEQGLPFSTNEGQNESQEAMQSTTSIRNYVRSQEPKENFPLAAMRKRVQRYNSYKGGVTNSQQSQTQQELVQQLTEVQNHLQLQQQQQQKYPQQGQPDDIFSYINDFLLPTDSCTDVQLPVSLTNQVPKDIQMNSQNQPSKQSRNINSRRNFLNSNNQILYASDLYTVNDTPMDLETGAYLLSPSHKESNLSKPASGNILQVTNLFRPIPQSNARSSNSRDPGIPVSDSISASQPYFANGNFNFTSGHQDAMLNRTQGLGSWQMSENRTSHNSSGNTDFYQDSCMNGLQFREPQNDLQALMILAGPSKPTTKKRRGRPLGAKNSVRTTQRSAKSKKIPQNNNQITQNYPLFPRDTQQLGFVQPPYPKQPPGYPHHTSGYAQQHSVFTQQSRSTQKPPRYPQQTLNHPEQPGHNQQLTGYGQQFPKYTPQPCQQISGYTQQLPEYINQTFMHNSRQQLSGYLQFPEPQPIPQNMHPYPERSQQFSRYSQQLLGSEHSHTEYGQKAPDYMKNLSENSQQRRPLYSQQTPNFSEQLLRYTQPFMEYIQQAKYFRQHPPYADQLSKYNHQLTSQTQNLPEHKKEFRVQGQQIPARSQQYPTQTRQFPNQPQQLSEQTQQFSDQVEHISGNEHFFDEAQCSAQNKQPQYLPNPLQSHLPPLEQLPSLSQHIPNTLEHLSNPVENLPENSQQFSSSNSSDFQNQPNPQNTIEVSDENPISESSKPIRSWHIPETLSNNESESSEQDKSAEVDQAEAIEHSEDIPSVPIQQNPVTVSDFPDSKIIPNLPSFEETYVLRSPSTNQVTAFQTCSFEKQSKQLQQTLQHENVLEVSCQQFPNPSQVLISTSVGAVTDSTLRPSLQNSDPVIETSTRYLEGRDWLLKSPAPLKIDCPKDTKKRKQTRFKTSEYKPHKGLKATIRRYRAKGIPIRSPSPGIYLQGAARNVLDDIHDSEEDAEDQDYQQDTENRYQVAVNNKAAIYNKVVKNNKVPQSFKDFASKGLVSEKETQKHKMISKDPTTSFREENESSPKCCSPSKQDLPTALDVSTGRWTTSGGFKKSKIQHQGLPNLQGLLLKSSRRKITHKKQESSLNISTTAKKNQEVPKKIVNVEIITINE